MRIIALCLCSLIFLTSPAAAYIGPGAGAGVIAVVLGVIGAFFMTILALVWYPVKRLLKKTGKKAPADAAMSDGKTGP